MPDSSTIEHPSPALATRPQPVLCARGLTREFRGFVAVNDVNLDIMPGSTHALIGPNGAGKTTCFNLLSKTLAPTRGTIVFDDRDITAASPARVARLGLVRSFQISSTFAHLTALENVRIALQQRRAHNFDFWRSASVLHALDDEALSLLEEVGLADFASIEASRLSYGRKRALEIATTLAMNPKLILLDEPTSGMTVEDVGRIVNLIRRVRANRTIVIVEHNLSVVEGLCDDVTVLARGSIIAQGDYKTVSQDAAVISSYLGNA